MPLVLRIAYSVRSNGNTEKMLKVAPEAAKKVSGTRTLMITLVGKKITPCDACDLYHITNTCRINDDIKPVPEYMKECDTIIIAAPVYIHNARVDEEVNSLLKDKIGAAIVVGQEKQRGKAYALSTIINFFLTHHMIVIGGTFAEGYPSVAAWTFGSTDKDAVLKDEVGILAAKELGWRVAHLTKILEGRKTPSIRRVILSL